MEAIKGLCPSASSQHLFFGKRSAFSLSLQSKTFIKASQQACLSPHRALLLKAGRSFEALQHTRNQAFFLPTHSRKCATDVLSSNAVSKPAFFGAPVNTSRAKRHLRTLRVGPDTLTRFGESEETEDSGSDTNDGVEEWWQDSGTSEEAEADVQSSRAVAPGNDATTDWAQKPAVESRWERDADDELSEGYSSDEEDFDSGEPPSAALTVLGDGPVGESSDQDGLKEGLGEGAEEEWQETRMVDRVWELIERVQAGDGETVKLADLKAIFGFPIDKFQVSQYSCVCIWWCSLHLCVTYKVLVQEPACR